MRKRRLVWRLFWAYLGITLAVMLVIVAYASHEVQSLYQAETALDLEAAARACQAELAEPLGRNDQPALRAGVRELSRSLGVRVTVIQASGKVLADNQEDPRAMEDHRDRPEVIEALHGAVGRSRRHSDTLAEDYMYVAVPLHRAGAVQAVIRTAMPLRTFLQTVHAAYREIAVAGLGIVAVVAAVSFLVARRIARPLDEIRRGAERFARGDLEHRLPGSDWEEIGALAGSLNHMAEQLDERIHTILRQQNEHEAMLSSMEEGVLAVDRDGTVLRVNEACERLLGVECGSLRGRAVYQAVRKPELVKFIETALASTLPVHGDLRVFGGQERRLHAHATALHDSLNRKIGTLIVLHDVTRLRHLEDLRRDSPTVDTRPPSSEHGT